MTQPIRWWNRIGVRLLTTAALVMLAGTTLIIAIVLRIQERSVIDQIIESTVLLSETIRRSTYHDMLEDRRDAVYRMLDEVGRDRHIGHVRIFNKEGLITFSTRMSERGTHVDKQAESCYACHAENQPLVRLAVPSRARIFPQDGRRVLGLVTPIYNEPSCSTASCHAHPPQQQVIGVVDIAVDLAPVDARLAQLRWLTAGSTFVTILALAGILALFARRYVVGPVRRLLEATRRMRAGELETYVSITDEDEFGQLGSSFNKLADSLAKEKADRLALLESLERQVEARTAELKRAQDRMVQAEKLSSLGRLAASVAHEINNPLAGILTYAKLIIRTLEAGPVKERDVALAVKHLQLVQRESERCTAIVRNLLDFARERPLSVSDADINRAIEEALTLVGHQADLQNIEVVRDLGEVPPLHADFGQLRQAIVNIVINACDAMPKGGRLHVATRFEDDRIVLRVTDTGGGIPPHILPRILDPFFTTKEKGTGLGLSVVYGIVERHRGTIDFDSREGDGTTVTIKLPLTGPGDAGETAPAPANAARSSETVPNLPASDAPQPAATGPFRSHVPPEPSGP